jgi:hypothetical protein
MQWFESLTNRFFTYLFHEENLKPVVKKVQFVFVLKIELIFSVDNGFKEKMSDKIYCSRSAI